MSVAMFLSNILLLSLATFALGDSIPLAAATTDLGSAPTDSGSSPSEAASMSEALASLSSLESLTSGMPTLGSSAESVLLTAIPTGVYTGQTCQTTTPAWYNNLPADVKSAISSYDSTFASWYAIHSTDFDITATLPGNVCAGTIFISGSGVETTVATATTAHSTTTGAVTATTGKGTTSATGSGTAASASGTSGFSSSSKAAAPRATGAVGVSFAGVVGVLGLMVAL